jgi:hypothetical protein
LLNVCEILTLLRLAANHSRSCTSQHDHGAFLISQVNGTRAADQGAATSNRTISAEKVA